MKSNLEELGLTEYEAKAYEVLIKLKKASAPKVSQESGIPYGKIYDTLQRLVSKKLVKILPEKSKMFVPASPDELHQIINEKRKALDSIEEDVKRLKRTYIESKEPPILIAEGERNFWKIVKKPIEPKKYSYVITYNVELDEKMKRQIAYAAKKEKYKGIDSRSLDPYNKETASRIKEYMQLFPQRKRRKLPFKNKGIVGVIQDDNIVLLTLINANTTMLIRDKAFTQFMKQLYLNTWDKAEKIE